MGGNRDGTEENYSFNHGVEGPADDVAIEKLRLRQIKNFFTILLLSQGTPMFAMGDEVRRTQQGNNNAYCQDNTISWFDWDHVERHHHLLNFVKSLIYFSLNHEIFQMERCWNDPDEGQPPNITWHGIHLGQPDWSEDSHSLAYTLSEGNGGNGGYQYHFMINAYKEDLQFEIPDHRTWYRIIDTYLDSPKDFVAYGNERWEQNQYLVKSRTIVVLMSKNNTKHEKHSGTNGFL